MKVEPRSPHFQDLPDAIKRALAIEPDRRSGTIRDVDHVVILMQENRSFDHYFGTLPGVRGFADPHPAPTPGGDVLTQAGDGIRTGPYALQPEHRSDTPVGYITPHTWDDAQRAWNDGRMDQWLPAKGRLGMGAYGPAELPFQTALADAFTLCEAYHCSMQAGTNPNRLFLWTGANDPRGEAGGPALVNTHDRLGPAAEGYAWTTYPERLQQAGVDWRIYQDMADNFNDNPWPAFANTARRMPPAVTRCASAPCRPARCKTWRATSPPAACPRSRGSSRPPPTPSIRKSRRAGGAYTERVLDILTRNPAVWSRCVFFVTYDENDCFYDHVPPPAPPRATTARDRAACPPWSWTASTTTRAPAPAPARPTTRRPARPRLRHGAARAHAGGVALEPGRLGQRAGVRPHLGDPFPGSPPWRHGTQHQRLAPRRRRRPDLGAGLQRRTRPSGRAARRPRDPDAPQLRPALCAGNRGPHDGRRRKLPPDLPQSRQRGRGAACVRPSRPGRAAPALRWARGRGWTMAGACRLAATTDCGCWARTDSTANSEAAPRTAACSRRSWCRSARPAPATDQLWRGAPAHESGIAHRRRLARGGACTAGGAIELKHAGSEGWYDLEITVPDMPAFGRRLAGRIASGKPGVPDPRLRRGWTLTPWTGRD